MMAMIKNVIAQLNMVILLTSLFRGVSLFTGVTFSGALRPNSFNQSENPTLFTWHLIQWLRLINVHHAHRGVLGLTAADGAEMRLRVVLDRDQRFNVLAVFPAQVLLTGDQGDQQRQYAKQTLLDKQWRDTHLSGTWASHPEFLTLIRLGQFISARAE
jgi:hypothetical protein